MSLDLAKSSEPDMQDPQEPQELESNGGCPLETKNDSNLDEAAAERMRIHESYAAQYSREAQGEIQHRLGYVPASATPAPTRGMRKSALDYSGTWGRPGLMPIGSQGSATSYSSGLTEESSLDFSSRSPEESQMAITLGGPYASTTSSGDASSRPLSGHFSGRKPSEAASSGAVTPAGRGSLTAPSNYKNDASGAATTGINSNESRGSTNSALEPQNFLDSQEMCEPRYSGFAQFSTSGPPGLTVSGNSMHGFLEDPTVSSLSLQLSQLTPAPTPLPVSTAQSNAGSYWVSGNTGMARNRRLTKSPVAFVPSNRNATELRQVAISDKTQTQGHRTISDTVTQLRQAKPLTSSNNAFEETLGTSSVGNGSLDSGGQYLYNQNSMQSPNFQHSQNEDNFIQQYFRLKNMKEPEVQSGVVEENWAFLPKKEPRSSNPSRLSPRSAINERWTDLEGYQNAKMNTPKVTPVYPAAYGGIDHYHGSPQQTSRTRTGQSSHPHYVHPSYGVYYTAPAQRCGEACYSVKLELGVTRKQLEKCMKEKNELFKAITHLQQKLSASEDRYQQLLDHISLEQGHPAHQETAEIITIEAKIQAFYTSFLQQIYRVYRGKPDTKKDDQYFRSEFEMFFRGIKCWADRFLKFPTNGKYPRDLENSLKEVCVLDEYVETLLSSDKTKSFVVQGLAARILILAVLRATALRDPRAVDNENEFNKRCDTTCKALHAHIRPLLSRLHDQSANEASFRTFLGTVKHAARLAVAINECGGPQAWFIEFPSCHEPFRSELMEDVEKFAKNGDHYAAAAAGGSGSETDALVKMAAMPLVMRMPADGGPPTVIFKAQVICV